MYKKFMIRGNYDILFYIFIFFQIAKIDIDSF